jgi:transposase
MKRKLPHIDHSREELHQLLKAERDVQKRQRLQALYLLASRQAKTRLAVAELLGVHRHSVGTWLEWYEQGGLEGLLTIKKAPGKKPLASPEVVEALKERLHHPEGFRAYGEIQAYLAQEHGVSMAYSSVHALVRYRLGAKPKSPRRSHPKKTLTRSARSSPTYLPTWEPLQKQPARGATVKCASWSRMKAE